MGIFVKRYQSMGEPSGDVGGAVGYLRCALYAIIISI